MRATTAADQPGASGRRPFEQIAGFYARCRPGWPDAVFQRIIDRCGLDGTGRLLDLGCGPGTLTLSLAGHVAEAVGLDPEPDMLAEARAAAERRGARNVTWRQGRAEALTDPAFRKALGPFRLVTLGSSFHWMDRAAVAAGACEALEPRGVLVIVEEEHSRTSLRGLVDETLRGFVGELPPHPARPTQTEAHEEVVARGPFARMEREVVPYRREWTVDRIIGWVYSFSQGGYVRLGARRPEFERALRRRLLALDPGGIFAEDVGAELIVAWKT